MKFFLPWLRGRNLKADISWLSHERAIAHALRAIAAAALALAALTGCTAGLAPARMVSPAEGLRVAVPSGEMARALAAAAEAYASVDGGEPVTVEAIDSKLYNGHISAALLAGLDDYDLLLLQADSIPRWVEYGALHALKEPADGESIRQWLGGLAVGADLYAIPAQPDPLVLWYRADLLEASGLSPDFARWQDFVHAGRTLGGVALVGDDTGAGADFLAALSASDPQAYAALVERGEVTSATVDALEQYAELFGATGITPAEAAKFQRGDVAAALEEGRAGLGFAPLSAAGRLLDCSKERPACKGGMPLLQAASLPGTRCAALGNLGVWTVPLNAPHTDAASRFAAWLASEDGGLAWASGGGLPANRAALGKLSQAGAAEATDPSAASMEARALYDTDCYTTPFAGLSTADEAWKALDGAVHRVLAGEENASAALNEAGQKIQKALRQGGVLK